MTEVIAVSTPNICDFIDGERDCKQGKDADPKRSENYQRGYGFQYGIEESKSEGYKL